MNAIATVAASIAAVAALVSLVYVRRTLEKADETLRAIANAHVEEMNERRRALEADLSLSRIHQAQQVLDATIELRELAYLVVSSRDPEANQRRLPAAGAKLGASLAALNALQWPPLDQLVQLAKDVELQIVPAVQILGTADVGINQIRDQFASLMLRLD